MATTYYLRNTPLSSNPYAVGRPDYTGAAQAKDPAYAFVMSTTAGTSTDVRISTNTYASGTYVVIGGTRSNTTDPGYSFVTPPLSAVTVSQSIAAVLNGYEAAMTTNIIWNIEYYRLDAAGNYVSTIGSATTGTEMSSSRTNETLTLSSPTSTSIADGDRIAARIWVSNNGTMAAGTPGNYLYWENTTGNGTSYITFTDTLSEYTGPTGTVMYLTNTASDLGGSGNYKASATADGGNTNTTTNTSAAPADPGNQLTATAGGTALAWFTPALAAITISGRMKVDWYGSQSNAAANTYPWIKIERTNNSGTVQSTIYSGALYMEQDTTTRDMEWFPLPTSTGLSLNDRIKFTLYIASNKGYGAQATSYTATVPYGTATGVNVRFTEAVSYAPQTKTLTASQGFSVAIAKKGQKPLTATQGFTGASPVRKVSRALTAALTPAAAAVRKTARSITASASFTGAQTRIKLVFKVLTATLTSSAAFTKSTKTAWGATQDFAGSMVRSTKTAWDATQDFAGSLLRVGKKPLEATLASSATLVNKTSRAFEAALTSSASLTATFVKLFTATLTMSASLSTLAMKRFAASLTPAVDFIRQKVGSGVAALTARHIHPGD